MSTVLMVAEKPSIALALAQALSQGAPWAKRRGISPSAPVYEFDGAFAAAGGIPVTFRVTSTVGHMFSLDFPPQYNDQNKVDPIDLFDAPTLLFEDARARMSEHLRAEARGCFALVLWLDCDREGENICFEVLRTCQPYLLQAQLPGAYLGNVFRARFSSLAPADLLVAMARLSVPNEDESRSVDARQLIDLKLGVAFSRFQTRYFRRNFPQLGKLSVTYGAAGARRPAQTGRADSSRPRPRLAPIHCGQGRASCPRSGSASTGTTRSPRSCRGLSGRCRSKRRCQSPRLTSSRARRPRGLCCWPAARQLGRCGAGRRRSGCSRARAPVRALPRVYAA